MSAMFARCMNCGDVMVEDDGNCPKCGVYFFEIYTCEICDDLIDTGTQDEPVDIKISGEELTVCKACALKHG